jgi:hypothetical protein
MSRCAVAAARRVRIRRRALTEPSSTRETGEPWTDDELTQLRELAERNTPAHVIGLNLGRSENAVRAKADQNGITLQP